MNIPQSVLEPFGFTGIPTESAEARWWRITKRELGIFAEATMEFFSCQRHIPMDAEIVQRILRENVAKNIKAHIDSVVFETAREMAVGCTITKNGKIFQHVIMLKK